MQHNPPTIAGRKGSTASARGTGLAAAVLWTLLSAGSAAAEEYRLQPGDVIEISVAGIPDMRMRAAVQIDGSLSVPLAGPLEAAGLTVGETRSRIQTALASRLLPAYLPDGREVLRAVGRDQISASVAEYRPVFVSGDVTQPGELPFRPGMTVRHVIAAAGGGRVVAAQPTGENEIDLRASYTGAWQSAAAASATVWRLRQELGEKAAFQYGAWPKAPGSGSSLEEILRVEADIREARLQNHNSQTEYLRRTLYQIDAQIEVLRELLEVAKENEEVDAKAMAVAKDAMERGLLNQARIADIRVAALISSTRRLQTASSLMQLERRRTEVARELARLDEQRRLDLLSDLQAARVKEAKEVARLRAADEKLRAAGLAPPAPAGDDAGQFAVRIIRDGSEIPGPVTHDSEIQPGDVVEVHRGHGLFPVATGVSPQDAQGMQTAAALE